MNEPSSDVAPRPEDLASQRRPDVSVVLPTFNERDNIVPLVEELRSRFCNARYAYEILVVDDRSPDGTAGIVAAAFAGDRGIHVISREQKPGLAYAIRDGIEYSTGAIVLVMDADFNHQPGDAVLLFEIARHVDLAIGSRFTFGGGMSNRPRYFLSYLYNAFLRFSLGTRMDENLSGFFAIKRERLFDLEFEKIFWGYGDYFFRLLLLSQRKRYLHVELPIFYGDRHSGVSKTQFLKVFMRYTREVFYLIYRRVLGQW